MLSHMGDFFGAHPWWLLSFFAIGVLATLTAIISLFMSLGRRPQRMWTDEVATVDSPDFLRSVAALLNVPLRAGGTAHLLNNGDAWLPAMFQDFDAAERSINIMSYIWEPGRMSDLVFDRLIDRCRAGIEVRVLLDGLGGIRCPDEDIERLRQAGGKVATFRPAQFGKLTRFHKRNHRRAIVIDGRIGYTGGMAVGDKWLGNAANENEWRDSMTRVTGCLTENLQSAFSELWAYCTGEVLTGDSFFPDDLADDNLGLQSIGIVSSPSSEEHPLRLFFFLAFLAARQRLWITTPYFVPDAHTRRIVKRRARAGVDVRILMPDAHTDAWPIRRTSHSYYRELMDAGVRIYEYRDTMMHSKHVVVDGMFSVVGSANMDIRSKELNEENVVALLDPVLSAELEQAFLQDLERATLIDPRAWRRRGLGARLIERFARLFAEQY
ncbi:MAG TPA: phospholipase D-like domain-containing protein [Longimicrobiales bacterium]|nr:phospholipase D-like domain-containing protein [Longimicrobiales bacterium]